MLEISESECVSETHKSITIVYYNDFEVSHHKKKKKKKKKPNRMKNCQMKWVYPMPVRFGIRGRQSEGDIHGPIISPLIFLELQFYLFS